TRRVFKGRLNAETGAWELAPTNLVRFWEVPFSVIFSMDDETHECEEYLNTMLQRINYISPSILQKDPRLKLQIAQTLADLDKLAEKNDLSNQRSQINQAATDFGI
ncbi:MAG TPA: hypothetical protein VKK79_24925, partial [Candidatus Lokiarchaeia archaeon]|nr:hypothetical protein [Candidatus Lokiarchaeia archaeon]